MPWQDKIILNSTALVESRNKKINKMTNIGLILKQKI